MEICSDNLKIIIDFLRTKDLQETFVSKKKSREMRCENLFNQLLENINFCIFSSSQQMGEIT